MRKTKLIIIIGLVSITESLNCNNMCTGQSDTDEYVYWWESCHVFEEVSNISSTESQSGHAKLDFFITADFVSLSMFGFNKIKLNTTM